MQGEAVNIQVLKRVQKKDIYLAITQAGLDVSDFDLTSGKSANLADLTVTNIDYRNGGHYTFDYRINPIFRVHEIIRSGFSPRQLQRCSIYSPAEESSHGDQYFASWEQQFEHFRTWLIMLTEEIETPDYWEELAHRASEVVSVIEGEIVNGEYFTADEKNRIQVALDRIEQRLLEDVADDVKLKAFVVSEIGHLKEASDEFTKKDWLLLAIGGLIQIATTVGLNAAVMHELFMLLKEGLGGAIKALTG